MRSRSNGSLNGILIFIPLLTVPLLAIFGIPQFAPVVASPGQDGDMSLRRRADDDRLNRRDGNNDLLEPFDADAGPRGSAAMSATRTDTRDWIDPFQQAANQQQLLAQNDGSARNAASQTRPAGYAAPANAYAGWKEQATSDVNASPSRTGQGQQPRNVVDVATPADGNSANIPVSTIRSNPYRPDRQAVLREIPLQGPAALTRPQIGPAESEGSASGESALRHVSQERELPRPASAANSEQFASIEPPAQPLTWASAVQELNALGIRQFRLQPGERPGEFHFTCFFTPKDNPRITHRFEAEAAEPLRAVQKVLDQIREWLAGR